MAQGGIVSPVFCILNVKDIPTPSRHVLLEEHADDAALVATPRSPSLLVGYVEAYVRRLEHWLRDWRESMNVSESPALLFSKAAKFIQKPRPVQSLGESIQWVESARYLVYLDTQLTWLAHVNQVRMRAAKRLSLLGLLLNRRNGLFVRKWVLIYKQLIRFMMHYACPMWRSAARSHVRKLQVLQSRFLRIATNAPWYVSNRQIHEDLRIPFIADPIRAPTEFLDSKLAEAGNPLFSSNLESTCADQGLTEVTHD
jgi:hypothetical protein